MKRVVIKNFVCILSTIGLVALFFILYGFKLSESSTFPKMLPFYMMGLALGVFSLYWSLREANIISFRNLIGIYFTLFFTILYVIIEAVNITLLSKDNISTTISVISYVLFSLSCLCMLFDFSYAIYVDVKYLKANKIIRNN